MPSPAPASDHPEASSIRLQRQQGFRWLNFSPELEAAYRQATKPVTDHQSNVALFCGLVIWLAFIGMDLARLHGRAAELFSSPVLLTLLQVRFTVLLALLGCLLALIEKPPRFKRPWVVAGMIYLVTLGGTIANVTHVSLGTPNENSVLILLMVVIFLPLGLRLKEASALALLCLVSVLLVGLPNTAEANRDQLYYRVFSMLVAAVIGGMGAYLREYAQREQFLLRAELEWLARRDALTGLLNRRAFNEHLALALSVARREQQTVALLMVDADHFKLYNDAYGHVAGDHALQQLAQVLQSFCRRPLDHAARTGGEEMALVLYGVNATHAQALCEQLLQRVQTLALEHSASPTAPHVTVSVGCALSEPQEEASHLYKRADALLYQAKRQGRNQAAGPA
jgi:diguanylate cyclase (GGDEF)-like protein